MKVIHAMTRFVLINAMTNAVIDARLYVNQKYADAIAMKMSNVRHVDKNKNVHVRAIAITI